MENNMVVQSNDLAQATYLMSTKEKEVLLACISQIDSRSDAPNINKQTKFVVTVEQIREVFYKNTYDRNLFRDLSDASRRLFGREVTIKLEGNKTLLARFVSSVLFDPDQARVTLNFSEEILPYLTQLRANFTKYRLIEISELSSIHSIRLYELIICWIGQRQYSQTLDLDEFRHIMGVADKYKQFGQLRERVIDKAIEEINANTEYEVSVDYRKVRRSYVSLTLKFHKKTFDKLIGKDKALSAKAIKSIIDNTKFMLDYNNHPSLSHNGKSTVENFKREMTRIIQQEPESFKSKPLENYLPKIKQGE